AWLVAHEPLALRSAPYRDRDRSDEEPPRLPHRHAAGALPATVGHGQRGDVPSAATPRSALRVLVDPARGAAAGGGRDAGRARLAPCASRGDRRPSRRGGHAGRAGALVRGAARDDRGAAGSRLRLRDGRRAALALVTPTREETDEVESLAEAPLHDRAIAQHLGAEGDQLARTEIEAPVERLECLEDLSARQVWIADHARLRAAGVHEAVALEPALRKCLSVQLRTRIRRGERDLQRVRIDRLRKTDRRLDRLARLARQAED